MEKRKLNFDLYKLRKERRLTQENLAEKSGLTIRTIQRIEKGEVVPYDDTLKKLAAGLEMTIHELEDNSKNEVPEHSNYSTITSYFHFTPIIGVFIPSFNIIIPFFLWLHYRTINQIYDAHGKISLNFQITMTLMVFFSIVMLLLYFPIGMALLVFIYTYTITCCLLNGFRSLRGELPKFYVFIPFLK
ncbi:helix-turn-helix domain-containing protein [Sphingobacterium mizutaii]|uniref:helix-turn-helix domain-containing protein n=1 Tax=Sphingobacterium mizutaii TaxID=1010 RepID=UPI0016247F5A|nr:helix-turn-helix domain-containing protein [Sphingobacterium mizutaii]